MTNADRDEGAESDVPDGNKMVAAENDSRSDGERPATEAGEDKKGPQVSVSLRTLIYGAVACLLVATVGVLASMYLGVRGELRAENTRAGNVKHAEDIALDYAVDAAEMDYRDLNAWRERLVKGTSPELKERLTKAANDMEQILAPLHWNSTARPLAAKVRSEAGGVYTVDSFVSVLTKTIQAPEGLQSTATYSITIDSNSDWQISDVGGVGSVLGPK